mmetsp:Transcript_107902/g.191137  ORF Transcript_107902/g.191137 Transcript_107902/m.191137 type:complete len:102 (-) Transcript_107902:128-433(-)
MRLPIFVALALAVKAVAEAHPDSSHADALDCDAAAEIDVESESLVQTTRLLHTRKRRDARAASKVPAPIPGTNGRSGSLKSQMQTLEASVDKLGRTENKLR